MPKDNNATATFIRMLTIWKSAVPEALVKLDPGLVIRFLNLSSRQGGIFLAELNDELAINQSWASKLAAKLEAVNYIVRETLEDDGRRSRIMITATGKSALAKLEENLRREISPQRSEPSGLRRRKGIAPVKGQRAFDLSE